MDQTDKLTAASLLIIIDGADVNKQTVTWKAIVSQPFDENSYIFGILGRPDCLVVDPGFEPEKITKRLEIANLVPAAILNTHGHADHIAGNAFIKSRWPDIPLMIGERDAHKLTDPAANLSAGYGFPLISPPADRTLTAGETLEVAGICLEVRLTPGHSPGHIILVCRQAQPWVVIGGDMLFRGSVGRTDFSDGNFEDLYAAIHREMFSLPDETIVLAGHGPPTTIGEEKATNPYVGRPVSH